MSFAVVEDLMKRHYRAEIDRSGDTVLAELPELGLVAEAKTADEALLLLDEKRRALFEDYLSAGDLEAIPRPATFQTKYVVPRLRQFVFKAAVVTFCIILVILSANVMFT